MKIMSEELRILLQNRQDLICNLMFERSEQEILKILKMKEWEDPKFAPLLTSTIWSSKAETIKEKLHLFYWNLPQYQHLLTPSIFAIKVDNIEKNILLFQEYGIDSYISVSCLRKNPNSQRVLLKYMVENDIPLITDEKINPMIIATNKVLKEKYRIDMKYLLEHEQKGGMSR